jgi:hypothetical protein
MVHISAVRSMLKPLIQGFVIIWWNLQLAVLWVSIWALLVKSGRLGKYAIVSKSNQIRYVRQGKTSYGTTYHRR